MGVSLGMIVEGSVAVLLAVTIGYCVVLNARLKRLHADREALAKIIGDLVQATTTANGAVKEFRAAAGEVDAGIDRRLDEAAELQSHLSAQIETGTMLLDKITRITSASRAIAAAELRPEPARVEPAPKPAMVVEPQSRLHSALQQLAMRPSIGGTAA
jgi:hypothetical protein